MSELHKFIFDGLPVRGAIVRLTDAWAEILRRRASNTETGAYPPALQSLLGEMSAAATLMQSGIRFDGALVLQIFGAGPVKLAVVEVQTDLALRSTANWQAAGLADDISLSHMVNVRQQGRCAITLDPQSRSPGRQPYQGVVPLVGDDGQPFEQLSEVLQHYMLKSEQLDTTLVLAADDKVAAGLLIQRLPMAGGANLAAGKSAEEADVLGENEDYRRIAILAQSLKREELLTLDVDTLLRRLFWEEPMTRFAPQQGADAPRFRCNCSRERVARMIVGLGADEVEGILAEREKVEVGCEFCGLQYRFDAVDAAQLFVAPEHQVGNPGALPQ